MDLPGLQVDNVILRDPPMLRSPLFVGLDLTPLLQPQQQQPCPGGYFQPLTLHMSKSAEALLRAQGHPDADQEIAQQDACTQHAKHSQEGSALQQLVAILKQDMQWVQVCDQTWQHCTHCCCRVRATSCNEKIGAELTQCLGPRVLLLVA